MAEYLAIPALSAGVARAVVERCPRAGWFESFLNPLGAAIDADAPEREDDDTEASDRGSVAHSVLLERSFDLVAVIDPRDYPTIKKDGNTTPKGWTNGAIKAARDAARATGRVPMLTAKFAKLKSMVSVADSYLASLAITQPAIHEMFLPSGEADTELTVVWLDEEYGVLCKMRCDKVNKQRDVVCDYKTTAASVAPDDIGRFMASNGNYVSAAWYRRGLRAIFGVEEVAYLFLFQEVKPPYLCSLMGTDPAAFAYGERKVIAGLQTWRACMDSNNWPGFPNTVCYAEIPPWESAKWEEKEIAAYGSTPNDGIEYWRQP